MENSIPVWWFHSTMIRSHDLPLVENSLWWFHSIRTRSYDLPLSWRTVYEDFTLPGSDPTIYRSRGEQSMMISLYQDQIPRSTALVENSLWWFHSTRIRFHDLPLSWRSIWWFYSTRIRSHDLPLSWRTFYDDLTLPGSDSTIYRSHGEVYGTDYLSFMGRGYVFMLSRKMFFRRNKIKLFICWRWKFSILL